MNNIFTKNIDALAKRNQELAERLKKHIITDIPQLITENGAYNLLYKNTLIHNKNNPLQESMEIFSIAENTPVSIHLIYGLGLGYLFQIASKNSKGSVILYEPDLNILWISFTLVDFSNDIIKKNVEIFDNFEDLSEALYKKSGIQNTPQILSLPSQRTLNSTGFDKLINDLQLIIGTYKLDLKFTKQKFYTSLKMLLNNIPSLLNEIPLVELKDTCVGKTAVVVSAGPSLDKNIEYLKKYRNKFILFVVGTAARTIINNGIKPDFIVLIETYNSVKQLSGLDLSEINFITEPYSHPDLRKIKFKNKFSHISANSPINQFWSEICEEPIEEYWTKGTVSYTALNCARLLGCSKIILVGQDLAYIDGQCYSKNSAYKDLYCGINPETNRWEIMAKDIHEFANALSASTNINTRLEVAKTRLQNLNQSLFLVKGIQGDMIPTESVYAAFIPPLTEYTQHFNDRQYINTSLVGAQIDGFENLSLKTALENIDIIQNKNFDIKYDYKTDLIKNNLEKACNELNIALKMIEEGLSISKNLKNTLNRFKTANMDVLKLLKKVSLSYISLSSDFANKSKIFDFITIANKIDLDYEMKMTQQFDYYNVNNINDKLIEYFNSAKTRTEEVQKIIQRILKNESFNTKS